MFLHVREKSGKTKYLVYISFSLTIGIVVRKAVALSIASECELYHLALSNTKYISVTYLLGSIPFASFCKYVK